MHALMIHVIYFFIHSFPQKIVIEPRVVVGCQALLILGLCEKNDGISGRLLVMQISAASKWNLIAADTVWTSPRERVTRRLQDLLPIPQMLAVAPLPGDLTHPQREEGSGRKLLALGSGVETELCPVKWSPLEGLCSGQCCWWELSLVIRVFTLKLFLYTKERHRSSTWHLMFSLFKGNGF